MFVFGGSSTIINNLIDDILSRTRAPLCVGWHINKNFKIWIYAGVANYVRINSYIAVSWCHEHSANQSNRSTGSISANALYPDRLFFYVACFVTNLQFHRFFPISGSFHFLLITYSIVLFYFLSDQFYCFPCLNYKNLFLF